MHQDSWLHPSLADGGPASVSVPATPRVPRSPVALGTITPGLCDGRVIGGPAVALGGVGPDVWGDALRRGAPPAAPAPQARAPRNGKPASEHPHSAGPRARPRLFEFIGHGALSVTSSITGKHYRFTEHGAQLAVDPRDWSQLSRVPSLRAVVA